MIQIALAALSLLLSCRAVSSQSPAASFNVGPIITTNATAADNATDASAVAADARDFPVDEMVFFTFSFGFDDGLEREPTQEEVEEVLCIAEDFLRQKLASKMDDTQLFAVLVDWTYNTSNGLAPEDHEWSEGKTYPVALRFYVDATLTDGLATRIEKDTVFNDINLSEEEMITFITEHVWHVPKTSLFWETVRAHYNLSQTKAKGERTVMIPEANCPVTRAPTIAPLVSLSESPTASPAPTASLSPSVSPAPTASQAPTTSQATTVSLSPSVSPAPTASQAPTTSQAPTVSLSPSVSPAPTVSETLSPEQTDHMVYFQFDVSLEQSADEVFEEPSPEEVKALMCVVNTFLQEKLAEQTGDDSITSAVTNIRWITSASEERTGITLFFTVDTSLEGQDPVPVDTVAQVLQDKDEELLQFLLSEGAAMYLEDEEINPLLELPTDVSLVSLPVGYPVREGVMDVAAADCLAYDHVEDPQRGTTLDVFADPNGANETSTASPEEGDGSGGEQDPPVQEVSGSGKSEEDPDNSGTGTGTGTGSPATGNSDEGSSNNGGDGSGLPAPTGSDMPPQDGLNGGANPGDSGSVSIGGGSAIKVAINVDFVVSNLEDISDPDAIKHLGLSRSWPDFTKELVNKKAATPLLRGRSLESENPVVEYQPYSALISQVTNSQCGDHTMAGLTCHQVKARYEVTVRALADFADAERFYQVATYQAIIEGTYNSVLRNSVPGTPLYIGTIPDHGIESSDDSGGWYWWIILLLLLLLCCCCSCLLAALWWRRQNSKKEEECLVSEKQVVHSHVHTWKPSHKDDDNTEIFVLDDRDDLKSSSHVDEDPVDCRMLVPYNGQGTDLVPYTGETDCEDDHDESDLSTQELCSSSFRNSIGPTRRRTSARQVQTLKSNLAVAA